MKHRKSRISGRSVGVCHACLALLIPTIAWGLMGLDACLGGSVKQDQIRVPAGAPVKFADEAARKAATAPALRDHPAASTRPAATYRLTRQTVAGLAPMQWVFIIVTPEGYPWVGTDEQLRPMIEKAVPANATLEWVSGCKRVGGEPLDTAEALDALKAFCAARNVNFVHRAGF